MGREMQLVGERFRRRVGGKGQTMTEYALILATVALVLVALYHTAGTLVLALVGKVGPLL